MPRPVEEPTESKGHQGGRRFKHPAFGQISANRVSGGGTTLYCSDFEHRAFINIRVKRSVLERDLSRDWHFAGEEIVEVALSESQWATFVSAMNVGEGTPCTITALGREMVPAIPRRDQKTEFKNDIKKRLEDSLDSLRRLRELIRVTGGGLSKAKQAELLAPIDATIQQLTANVPFVVDCFDEHMEETVEKAKQEMYGHMLGVVARAGLEHLGAKPPIEMITYEEKTDDEDDT